jgi:hypothetical protein
MLLNCDASIGLARNYSGLQAKKGAFWGQKGFSRQNRLAKELGDRRRSARNLRAAMISGLGLLCATFLRP